MNALNLFRQKSIAIVICYLGKLPWYFAYFVHSCAYNASIDFFVITDDDTYSNPLPSNVRILSTTLLELNNIALVKLGLPVKISHGYKICDFKPTYGVLFGNILSGYDFWGHGDIDVIFGNIRNFITNDLLNSYDLISVRPDWIPGCFLLFRNIEKMNKLFSESKDYRQILCGEKYYGFDEAGFAQKEFSEGKQFREINAEIESMMHVVKKMEEKDYLRAYFDLHIIEGVPGRLKWEKGKLTYRNRYEALLYHLVIFKRWYKPQHDITNIPDVFEISSKAIYHNRRAKMAKAENEN